MLRVSELQPRLRNSTVRNKPELRPTGCPLSFSWCSGASWSDCVAGCAAAIRVNCTENTYCRITNQFLSALCVTQMLQKTKRLQRHLLQRDARKKSKKKMMCVCVSVCLCVCLSTCFELRISLCVVTTVFVADLFVCRFRRRH